MMITVANRMSASPAIPASHISPERLKATVWLAAFLSLWLGVVHAESLSGKVIRVSDGDTITVLVDRGQVKVRLADIDAPELGQPFGKRSRQSLAEVCAGKLATVDDRGRDRYGRTLGQVQCVGVNANAEQVRRGMAWVFVRYAPKDSPLVAVETEARLAKRGLWADYEAIAPWAWRRMK